MAEIPVEKKSGGFPWWWIAAGLLAALALVIALRGREHDTTATTADVPSEHKAGEPVFTTGTGMCTGDDACAEKELCIEGSCKAITRDLAACSALDVSFATGSATMTEEQKRGLDRAARCLKADHAMTMKLAGAADPRGATSVNDKLGEQRAHAVARELSARGVSADQLHIVSYGEHQLLCAESDEACWAKNRRTELRPGQ